MGRSSLVDQSTAAIAFGVVEVDSRAGERTPKASHAWLRRVADANAVVDIEA